MPQWGPSGIRLVFKTSSCVKPAAKKSWMNLVRKDWMNLATAGDRRGLDERLEPKANGMRADRKSNSPATRVLRVLPASKDALLPTNSRSDPGITGRRRATSGLLDAGVRMMRTVEGTLQCRESSPRNRGVSTSTSASFTRSSRCSSFCSQPRVH